MDFLCPASTISLSSQLLMSISTLFSLYLFSHSFYPFSPNLLVVILFIPLLVPQMSRVIYSFRSLSSYVFFVSFCIVILSSLSILLVIVLYLLLCFLSTHFLIFYRFLTPDTTQLYYVLLCAHPHSIFVNRMCFHLNLFLSLLSELVFSTWHIFSHIYHQFYFLSAQLLLLFSNKSLFKLKGKKTSNIKEEKCQTEVTPLSFSLSSYPHQ